MSETKETVYLDNSATTRICDAALTRYIEVSREHYGNPSSLHGIGYDAEKVLTGARETIKKTLSGEGGEIIFTSSGSEANNLALLGRMRAKERFRRGGKVIISDGEHASVDNTADELAREGFTVIRVPTVGGFIDAERLAELLDDRVYLVSIMHVNNLTGAVYDIPRLAELIRRLAPECAIHTDATQSYMKLPVSARAPGVDMITVSSHKIEGPKGVGALWVSDRLIRSGGLSPVIFGGGQERGLRSGTENVPAVAAFAAAAEVGAAKLKENAERLAALRGYIVKRFESEPGLSGYRITVPQEYAPHILNIISPGIRSETLLHYLSSLGIYVSSGSACSSNSKVRHRSALDAFGLSPDEVDCSVRVSLSHENTESDLDALAEGLITAVARLAKKR